MSVQTKPRPMNRKDRGHPERYEAGPPLPPSTQIVSFEKPYPGFAVIGLHVSTLNELAVLYLLARPVIDHVWPRIIGVFL